MTIERHPGAVSSRITETEQGVLVNSYNKEWKVLEQLPLGFYSVGDILLPFAVDSNGKLVVVVDSITIGAMPLPAGAATSALQLPDGHGVKILNALIPVVYDNIALSYTGSNLTGVVFKTGVTTVATLTLAYDLSDQLTSVVRS